MTADQGDRPATPQAPEPVPCAWCKTEIPADEAIQPEGQEYALYFCSPECYAAWRREQAEALELAHRRRSGTDQGT